MFPPIHTRRQPVRKRIIGAAAAMAVLLVLGYFSLDIYWIARGVIRGEAFYAGKPTSYWRGIAELERPQPKPQTPVSSPSPTTPAMASGFSTSPSGPGIAAPQQSWCEKFDEWKQNWLHGAVAQWDAVWTDPDAIPVLRELFHDSDEIVRAKAVSALCAHGTAVSSDLPELIDYLRATGGTTPKYPRLRIINALRSIAGAEALPALCDCLNDPDELVADFAHRAIPEYGPDAEHALPHLVRNLDGELGDRTARLMAEMHLADPRTILPVFAKELRSEKTVVRRNATHGVARLVYSDPAALALLIERTKDVDSQVRRVAVEALGGMRSKLDAVCAVLRVFNADADPKVRAFALASLDDSEPCMACNIQEFRPIPCLEKWIATAKKENHEDLYFEASLALDKCLRSGK
jgi:HEAT repeat protein